MFIGVRKHSLITACFLPDSLLEGINSLVVIESLTLEFIFLFWNKYILFIKEKIMNELNVFIKQEIMEEKEVIFACLNILQASPINSKGALT